MGGDLLERALAQFGIGWYVSWPCISGNDVMVVRILSRNALRAQPGDRIKTDDGGFIQKISAETWVQWRHYPPGLEAPPMSGKLLQWTPAKSPARPDGVVGQTPA